MLETQIGPPETDVSRQLLQWPRLLTKCKYLIVISFSVLAAKVARRENADVSGPTQPPAELTLRVGR